MIIEIQSSGVRLDVDGDDAQDAVLNWARSRTLRWWRENHDVVVLVNGVEYKVSLDYDLSCVSMQLTSEQAVELLGISVIPDTVKNWLKGGHFPGAVKVGDDWRFSRTEVEAVKAQMEALRQKNLTGDLDVPEMP